MRRVTAVLAALVTLAATVTLAGDTVPVPRTTASIGMAPPEVRACIVTFDGRTPVDNTCPQTCYRETWDGPVLNVENLCGRKLWIAYLFTANDGKVYRSACLVLEPHGAYSIEDTAIEPMGHREVLIGQAPGLGFPASGFTMWCSNARTADSETPVMK